MQWQLGIWEPSQHLLEDRGKPRKPVCLKSTIVFKILKDSVRTSKRTQHFTITKINWLTLFKEITAVYTENRMESININCRDTGYKAGEVYIYH
jgi:hypothetical protein